MIVINSEVFLICKESQEKWEKSKINKHKNEKKTGKKRVEK